MPNFAASEKFCYHHKRMSQGAVPRVGQSNIFLAITKFFGQNVAAKNEK